MYISKPVHGYRKVSNCDHFILNDVTLASGIIQCDHLRYLNINVHQYGSLFQSLDSEIKSKLSQCASCTNHGKLFVKIPFRYGRYQVKYKGLSTSDDFVAGKKVHCTVELSGLKQEGETHTCCFKLVEFEAI